MKEDMNQSTFKVLSRYTLTFKSTGSVTAESILTSPLSIKERTVRSRINGGNTLEEDMNGSKRIKIASNLPLKFLAVIH